jgi:two-component system, NtrC family, response regulator PilR
MSRETTTSAARLTPDRPVLVVDDEQSMREFLSIMLRAEGCEVQTARHAEEAIGLIESGQRFSLILSDLRMGGMSGLDLLRFSKERDPACQVVIMTAFATAETALSAIRDGAYDYMIKPFKVDQARAVVRRALEKYMLVRENFYLKQALGERKSYGAIIGKSEAMTRVFDLIDRVAPTRTTILITGESGTGKELVAKAIHDQSGVKDGPFVPINCGAIPENLIESELFGHKKGSFTGAIGDKKGLFEAAKGGTVFLDEIGELPLGTQVRFLRVLQERMIKPVGSATEVAIDCRVIAATNRSLREEIAAGRFREDLYYRLNVITLELPPLRERAEDLRLLINHFVARLAAEMGRPIEGVSADAMRLMLNYSYPGNVRELQNIIERAVTLERERLISAEVLPYQLQKERIDQAAEHVEIPEEGINLEAMVEDLERTMIRKALERSGGVKKEAAKLLGITFRAMRYRLDKYGMDSGGDE